MNILFILFACLVPTVVMLLGGLERFTLCCYGAVAAFAAWMIEKILFAFGAAAGLEFNGAFQAFFIFGLIEEVSKYAFLQMLPRVENGGREAVKAAIFCAIGFASLENVLYTDRLRALHGPSGTFTALLLVRFCLPYMMHVANAPLLVSGYCV
jgi:RsiW-degrading membrane proteinase PrsW (M82 family)